MEIKQHHGGPNNTTRRQNSFCAEITDEDYSFVLMKRTLTIDKLIDTFFDQWADKIHCIIRRRVTKKMK